MKVEQVFVIVATQTDGTEGIPAVDMGIGMAVPCVFSQPHLLSMIFPIIKLQTPKHVKLAAFKFTHREKVEVE